MDHTGAGAGWRDHVLGVFKRIELSSGNVAGIIHVAAVECGLPAARLLGREIHIAAIAAQQSNGADSHGWVELIDETGDEEGYFHVILPPLRQLQPI